MPYSANAAIEDLFDVAPLDRALTRVAERVGDDLLDRVERKTPVAKPPAGHDASDWVRARGGRAPGTLKESWYATPVERTADDGRAVEVTTDDPVAADVEWDTRPHLIRRKRARALRWFAEGGGVRFAEAVEHPGTSGVGMMRDSLAEIELSERRIGEEELTRWAREQQRLVR